MNLGCRVECAWKMLTYAPASAFETRTAEAACCITCVGFSIGDLRLIDFRIAQLKA